MADFDDDPDDNIVKSELTQYVNIYVTPQTYPDVPR